MSNKMILIHVAVFVSAFIIIYILYNICYKIARRISEKHDDDLIDVVLPLKIFTCAAFAWCTKILVFSGLTLNTLLILVPIFIITTVILGVICHRDK